MMLIKTKNALIGKTERSIYHQNVYKNLIASLQFQIPDVKSHQVILFRKPPLGFQLYQKASGAANTGAFHLIAQIIPEQVG